MSTEQYHELVEELNMCDETVGLNHLGLDRESIEGVLEEFNYELIQRDSDEVFFTDGDYQYQVFQTDSGKLDVTRMLVM
ncbi:hypothetical protein [Bacillus toyonensis]|uniref:hypothetical protein n=1 Tax=Bacillus toyonensis TaxID=155322 RepID=UPI000BF59E97|nr:hypothetical protein [Bacillus toyonensis]PGF05009.1 hypothetical protein COM61_00815 [Bacillus toyonensis]